MLNVMYVYNCTDICIITTMLELINDFTLNRREADNPSVVNDASHKPRLLAASWSHTQLSVWEATCHGTTP